MEYIIVTPRSLSVRPSLLRNSKGGLRYQIPESGAQPTEAQLWRDTRRYRVIAGVERSGAAVLTRHASFGS